MKLIHLSLAVFLHSTTALTGEEAGKDVMTVEYRSTGPYPSHGVTMAGALKALGITPDQIDYLKLVGDESSGTSCLSHRMKIDLWIWNRYFETAEPYKYWVPSGNRRLEIYMKGESAPRTTICINETDGCTADGDPRELRYMCHGLEKWFMANLDPEIGKEGGAGQWPTPSRPK